LGKPRSNREREESLSQIMEAGLRATSLESRYLNSRERYHLLELFREDQGISDALPQA